VVIFLLIALIITTALTSAAITIHMFISFNDLKVSDKVANLALVMQALGPFAVGGLAGYLAQHI
jgi:ABC-type glycerol-3-phosphate transport system permease component